MKHTFETKVYYADTDAYGVVWHGAYLRWLEKGRVELCDMLGLDLIAMKNADVLLPVTNMNVRYKSSARLNDSIIIETWIEKCNGLSVTFKQTIKSVVTPLPNPLPQGARENLAVTSKEDYVRSTPQGAREGRLFIEATFDVVAISEAGKLYRRMPDDIVEKLQKGIEKCPVSV